MGPGLAGYFLQKKGILQAGRDGQAIQAVRQPQIIN